ncbi:MAG: VWA domain-containing protein, partial [Rhodobacteraceae bacterium]|nr:VWA domain-containing protein [Paracoccaceae bacterium]
PPDLLTADAPERLRRGGVPSTGASGVRRKSLHRGRPLGARSGDPRAGGRLDLVETLRAAVPWAEIRRRAATSERHVHGRGPDPARPSIRRADLRVKRFAQPSESLTIFVVDASGSAAFHRLAEAKGAVELLLSRAYARRDQVAVIAFRRAPSPSTPPAELLLPPTRALARAKRALAALPGGGATPLADGLCAAADLAEKALRHGATPTVAVLTDGRANIALDGRPNRAQAAQDAASAAKRLATLRIRACVIDTSPRPREEARNLASAMAARYEPLPYSCVSALTDVVQAARDG